MTCKAIRQCDQMQCGRCGLAWDVGDVDRPKCSTDTVSLSTRLQRERSLWKVRSAHKFRGK